MRTCPFCAEEIQDAAVFCRYCRSDLIPASGPGAAPEVPPPPADVSSPHGPQRPPPPAAVRVLPSSCTPQETLPKPSISVGCALGIALLVVLIVIVLLLGSMVLRKADSIRQGYSVLPTHMRPPDIAAADLLPASVFRMEFPA